MRQECDENDEAPPASPDRAHTPTMGFSYDYTTDDPPDVQRIVDEPMQSSPYPDPPTLSARSGPTLMPPRPRSSSVPPTSQTIQRMAIQYLPVTETVSPPKSPVRAPAVDPQIVLHLRNPEEAVVMASGAHHRW